MSTQPLSIEQMSSALKKRLPQLASVPDDVLVKKVLQRRPELITKMSSSAAGRPMGTELNQIDKSMLDFWIQQGNVAKGAVSPEGLLNVGFAPGGAALNAYREIKALKEGGVEGAANKTMEQAGAFNPITDTVGGTAANVLDLWLMHKLGKGAEDPTAAGSLRGSMTRGKFMADWLDTQAKDIPVNWKPAYEWAQKAVALGKKGWAVPKPITDFVDWVDGQSKGGMERISGEPGSFADRGAQHPLPYQAAREFEQSLGAKIPWDQDAGGKMGGLMKKMRESLGEETATALEPHGLANHYLKMKADLQKAYGARARFGPIGKIAGKVAGYGGGSTVGHPWAGGAIGGRVGEGITGSMVDSVVNAGRKSAGRETSIDMATRRSAGGMSPVEQMRVAGDTINSLRMQIERQRATGDPGVYNTVSKLRAAQDQLRELRQSKAEPAESRGGVSKKLFVTRADEAAMRGLGYSQSIIDKMKPEQVQQILEMKRPAIGHERGGVDAEVQELKRTAQPERDTNILSKVRSDNPSMTLSQQLQEAAKLANPKNPGEVSVNVQGENRTATLSPQQMKRWNEAAERYRTGVEWAKRNFANDRQQMQAKIKGAGMRYAAEKREITGEHTAIEKRSMARREASNYHGKKVNVRGQEGQVTGTAFGKIRVKMPDGNTISVNPEDVQ